MVNSVVCRESVTHAGVRARSGHVARRGQVLVPVGPRFLLHSPLPARPGCPQGATLRCLCLDMCSLSADSAQDHLQFEKRDETALLLAGKICLNHLQNPQGAIEFAKQGPQNKKKKKRKIPKPFCRACSCLRCLTLAVSRSAIVLLLLHLTANSNRAGRSLFVQSAAPPGTCLL